MEDKGHGGNLRLLFAPGSSLGGARPKASVNEKDGQLAIAKFPRPDDEINTVSLDFAKSWLSMRRITMRPLLDENISSSWAIAMPNL
jgi:serine/threonine-protein kinase HipA